MPAPLTEVEVRRRLDAMNPEIPRAHYFELTGVPTVSPEKDEKFYRKAQGVNRLAELALHLTRQFANERGPKCLRVLDIASGDGALSIAFAKAGAREVRGVEGRELHVQRSMFAAEVLNVGHAKFELGDVRKISKERQGAFDLTLCFGILHHLGQDDFLPFLKSVVDVTSDMLILYTHFSTPAAVADYSLAGPVTVADGLQGYLLREHPQDATDQRMIDQVRASLDNTFSFWATDESHMRAHKRVGFDTIVKVYEPHVFGDYDTANSAKSLLRRRPTAKEPAFAD